MALRISTSRVAPLGILLALQYRQPACLPSGLFFLGYIYPMRTINRDCVCAMIFDNTDRLFQARRGNNHLVYPETWHIPGGGTDEGETHREALLREMQEELGLDLSPYEMELVDDQGTGESEKILDSGEKVYAKMRFFIYKLMLDKKGEDIPITLEEAEYVSYQWTDLKDIKNLQLTPPSIELFTRLGYIS